MNRYGRTAVCNGVEKQMDARWRASRWMWRRWAQEQFGSCELGDRRRNVRLVKFARQVAANPSASTPDQTCQWADCKAAYRLMDCDDIEFGAILAPHCRQTRDRASKTGRALLIHDKTEISFSPGREPIEGLGPTGNNKRQGFYLHTALKIADEDQEILGLAGQLLFYRTAAPKRRDGQRETVLHAKRRPRESEVWRRLIEQVGPAPAGQTFVHVCDREADNYEVYAQSVICGTGWIIRAAQLHRKVRPVGQTEPDQPRSEAMTTLGDLLTRQDFQEGYEVAVPATKKTKAYGARPASLDLVLDAPSYSVQRVGQEKRSGLHPHDGCRGLRGQTSPRSEAAEMGALHTRWRRRHTGSASSRPGLRATSDDRRLSQGNQDRLPVGGAAIRHRSPLGTHCGRAVGRGGASAADPSHRPRRAGAGRAGGRSPRMDQHVVSIHGLQISEVHTAPGRPPTGPCSSSSDAWQPSADSSDARETVFPVGSPSGAASPNSCS